MVDGGGGLGVVTDIVAFSAVKISIIFIFLCHTLSDTPTVLKVGELIFHNKTYHSDIEIICYFEAFMYKFRPKLRRKYLFP
jgi:hypothetical protein